ncbi:MAG: DMT family transporter [Candidatus Cloacimonetes bacterium]|nr:DMT family transporter [Candidatus Cloacimonadota bacterium]
MKDKLTYLRAVLSMFFWAITFVWYKIAYESYRPYEVVFLRLLLGAFLLFAIMLITRHREQPRLKDIPHFMLVAFFEPFLYFIGEANGMEKVSPSLGSIVIATIPIFAALGAWAILRERLGINVIIGLFLSALGVIIISRGGGGGDNTLSGISFLAIAIAGAVGYSVSVRPLTLRYSTLNIVAYQTLFGAIYFLPLFLWRDSRHFFTMEHSLRGLSTITAMCLFATIGAFMLYTDVIRRFGVAKANIFTNLIPVFTVVLAYFILGERIGWRSILGLLLTLGGLLLSQSDVLKPKSSAAKELS